MTTTNPHVVDMMVREDFAAAIVPGNPTTPRSEEEDAGRRAVELLLVDLIQHEADPVIASGFVRDIVRGAYYAGRDAERGAA